MSPTKSTVLFAASLVGVMVVGGFTMISAIECSYHEHVAEKGRIAYEQGAEAHRLGVPPSANPFQGMGQDDGERARMWLEGWMSREPVPVSKGVNK